MGTTEQIFQQLFAAEYGKLCRYALGFMQDSHAAEDVVQDTFIRIWETKRELIASPDIRFYLVTAVRNNCISALRKQKSGPVHFPEEVPEGDGETFQTKTQLLEDATERAGKIAAALDSLPPKCREVFLLVKMHSMSYKQVAEALSISVKTVEAQMGKALRTLRESTTLTAIILLICTLFVNPIARVGVAILKSVLS